MEYETMAHVTLGEARRGSIERRRIGTVANEPRRRNTDLDRSCDIGPGLRYASDTGGHGFPEPAREMTISEYQGYLQGTAGLWAEVLP